MDSLFDVWKTKIPKYSTEYKELFDSLTAKGGAEGEKKISLGKHFSNNYELYIYAFFLGLYQDAQIPIPEGDKGKDFSYAIEFWGRKSTSLRKDFTILQEFIFAALIAKSDFPLIDLEKEKLTEDSVVKLLINNMQSYANGGLQIIREKLEESPNYFLPSNSFLELILDEELNVEFT